MNGRSAGRNGGYPIVYHYIFYPVIIIFTLLSVTTVSVGVLRDAVYETHRRNLLSIVRVMKNFVAPELFTLEAGTTRLAGETSPPAQGDPARLASTLAAGTPLRITLIDATGRVVGDSHADEGEMDNHAGREEVRRALAGHEGESMRRSATLNELLIYAAIPVTARGGDDQSSPDVVGVVRASYVITDIHALLNDLYRRLITPGVLLLAAALAAAFAFSRSIRLPIRRLHRAAVAFTAGNMDHGVAASGPRELTDLAVTFGTMARELKRRIRQLDDQRRETEEVLNTIRDPLFLVDDHRRIQRLNDAAALFVTMSPAAASGRLLMDVLRNTELDEFVRDIQEGRTVEETHITFTNPVERHLNVWGRHLMSETSLLRGQTIVVLRDMTPQYRVNRIRRDFVANVSHELKTPLTMIQGAIETLAEIPPQEGEERRRFERMIADHAARMTGIVEDLLNLARIEQMEDDVQVTPTDITAILKAVVDAVAAGGDRHDGGPGAVQITAQPGVWWPVQPALFTLAVTNLVENALRYGGSHGPVVVDADTTSGTLVVTVSDSGPGIPEEERERIFERFYRIDRGRSRATGGTGLGLAIVRHIVRMHGGTVGVSANAGAGSIFTISIPGNSADGGTQ